MDEADALYTLFIRGFHFRGCNNLGWNEYYHDDDSFHEQEGCSIHYVLVV